MKKKKDYFFWNLQNTAEQLAFCDKKIIIFFFLKLIGTKRFEKNKIHSMPLKIIFLINVCHVLTKSLLLKVIN